MFGTVIGFYALIYMYIGYLNGFFKRIFFPDEVKLPLALIALSDFFCNIIIFFTLFWFRGRIFLWLLSASHDPAGTGLYDGCIHPALFYPVEDK